MIFTHAGRYLNRRSSVNLIDRDDKQRLNSLLNIFPLDECPISFITSIFYKQEDVTGMPARILKFRWSSLGPSTFARNELRRKILAQNESQINFLSLCCPEMSRRYFIITIGDSNETFASKKVADLLSQSGVTFVKKTIISNTVYNSDQIWYCR